MEKVDGWWFSEKKVLSHGDGRRIRIGRTHKHKGEVIPCRSGLHLSVNILDALNYARGPIVWRVRGSGAIVPHGDPIDKYACSERTYLAGGIDVTNVLWKFARMCALDVIHLWDAPNVVKKYLRTGDESLRAAARAAARDAAWDAAWAAARDAAWAAAQAAARAAARDAAWDAAWDAARAALRETQEGRLTRMILKAIKERS